MKKILSVAIFAIAAIFFMTGCADSHNSIKNKYSLPDDHVFVGIEYKDFISKAENGEAFLLFYGNERCSSCLENAPKVDEYAKYYKIEQVFYLNNTSLSEDEKKYIKSTYGIDGAHYPQLIYMNDNKQVYNSYDDFIKIDKTYEEAYRTIMRKYLSDTKQA